MSENKIFLPAEWLAAATPSELLEADALREATWKAFEDQKPHPVIESFTLDDIHLAIRAMSPIDGLRQAHTWIVQGIEAAELMLNDPHNYGYEPDAWDEIDWLVCRKRVENPGLVVKALIMGANGGGKTYFCASRFVRCATYLSDALLWAFSYDEQSSRRIPQPAIYRYLPPTFRTLSGKMSKTGKLKLSYNATNGFTDNSFSLERGTVTECRFYSSDIEKMEGPRPHFVWWDEEADLAYVDAMNKRLHSRAEMSNAFLSEWKDLLEQKRIFPNLKFPRERLHDLYIGVNLGSFTPTRGYTATVKRYVEGATTIRTVEATLLPLKDDKGAVTGFEKMPKVQLCEDQTAFVYYLHAWDNPFGGNWTAMQIEAKRKTREEILWWAYGVATKTVGTPFPNFSRAAHVRPLAALKGQKLTWYMACDPVANSGRAWFMLWFAINPLGEIFIAREFPCRGEFVENVGMVGEWALQGGKNSALGKRGPAQDAWNYGFEDWARQIKRIELEIAKGLAKDGNWDGKPIEIEHRIMDSRSGNTISLSNVGGKTLIECMDDEKIFFDSAGRDTPTAGGNRFTSVGEQIIKNQLVYDGEKVEVDPETGRLTYKGRSPKLYISEGCENTIDAFQNYPGASAGDSAWDDPIDCVRYLLIAEPKYLDKAKRGWQGGGSF